MVFTGSEIKDYRTNEDIYKEAYQKGKEEGIRGFMRFVVEHEENVIHIPDYLDGEYNVLPNTMLEEYLKGDKE